MISIDGVTKRYTFEEVQKIIEEDGIIEAVVAFRYTDLIDMTGFDEFWDRLVEGAVDADYVEKEDMHEEILAYNAEHDVILFKVSMSILGVEKYNY